MEYYFEGGRSQYKGLCFGGSKVFGSTKLKLNIPPGADYNSYQPNKVNYTNHNPIIRAKKACIGVSLNYTEHGVAQTTSVLKFDCLSFHWHISRLPPNFAKRYWTM